MLSNQVLQKVVMDMKGITQAKVSVWSVEGECLISTDEVTLEKEIIENYIYMGVGESTVEKKLNYSIHVVLEDMEPCYYLMLQGVLGDQDIIGELCVSQLENLLSAYKEKVDKNLFVQRLIKNEIEESKILEKSKSIGITNQVRRVLFVIEPKKAAESIVKETLKSIYITGIKDFVVEIDEAHVVYVKELLSTDTEAEIQRVAKTIADTISAEALIYVRVSYSNAIDTLQELAKAYKEAVTALDIGRSFYAKRTVLAYAQLGIGRLIHQLPQHLCKEFLHEVLVGKALSQFDDQTMTAAYSFFENNLNISETARQLYVHRNTLMYRLEKIQKKTGLDVRVFEDAMTFKLAIMVSNHLSIQNHIDK